MLQLKRISYVHVPIWMGKGNPESAVFLSRSAENGRKVNQIFWISEFFCYSSVTREHLKEWKKYRVLVFISMAQNLITSHQNG